MTSEAHESRQKEEVVFARSDVVAAATKLNVQLEDLDRRLRKARLTIPPESAYEEVETAFWTFVEALRQAEFSGVNSEDIAACREIVGRWLFRARIFNRAFHKPHGYAGDFMMVEWMYDLEEDSCAQPHQPGIVNCLDRLGKTVHSIRAVWERRRHYAALLRKEYERRSGALRVLDVATGGARYLRDFLEGASSLPGLSITALDQDSAAIAYCRTRSLVEWAGRVRFIDVPIRQLSSELGSDEFDVIISAGLFDYLDDTSARDLLTVLTNCLSPDGVIAISNFHPDDPSRLVKTWLVDWPLIYRTEDDCRRLFPRGLRVSTHRSADSSLVLASGSYPGRT
jgi:extracellular factor (EF) 3-hydroxypalmitic acid methyl ester biosynthesis protein